VTDASPLRLVVLYIVWILCGQGCLRGTSIALVRTDKQIVIATDSRTTDENGTRKPDVCKIRSAGTLYFTIVGQSTGSGKDFEAIAERMLQSPESLETRITAFTKEVIPSLNQVLESNAHEREIAVGQGSIMDIVVYGLDDGKLVVYTIKFGLSRDSKSVQPMMVTCPGTVCPNGRFPILAPKGSLDPALSDVLAVQAFVKAQIKKGDPGIGGCMQVIRIDATGKSYWLKKPKVCKNEK
jgi:hypothetical protein